MTAQDAYGNISPAYAGTVAFSSTDPKAGLPASSTLTNGTGSFGAKLKTVGTWSITANDTVNGAITGSQSGVIVNPAAAKKLRISAPSTAVAGMPFAITVTALDP